MILITWNVQWCRGVDGRVDPARIVDATRGMADFDLLCLQEVADNYPDPRLAGADDADQFTRLAQLLPGYTAVPAIAVDQPGEGGRRRRFGNMILSRLPVRQVYRHLLPYPCDPGVPGMPRIALEAVVATQLGDLRVVTTHLEYYSAMQRMVQVEALRRIYAEGHAHARDARITMDDGGPFHTFLRPRATLVAGDCNFEPDSDEYLRMLTGFDDATPSLFDAWRELHRDLPHPTTFRLYEKMVPDEPKLHCDFVFVSDELRARLRDVRVDLDTQASDHQPIVVTLG